MGKRWVPAVVIAVTGAAGVALLAVAPVTAQTPGTISACINSSHQFTHVTTGTPLACPSQTPVSWPGNVPGPPPSPSPSATSPSPSPTSVSPSPSPTASPTGASGGSVCNATNGTCGPYDYPGIPMSNGYDTYVEAQQVGPNAGTADTVHVTDPGNWTDTANAGPSGYTGVQMFDNVQQLTNDWNGSGWGGATADTPLGSLSSLTVTYAENSPADAGSVYEFAPDVWDSAAPADVMFWADTSPRRCTDNGLNASDIYGQATLGGQPWTVYHYGGEVIFILDGAASTDPVGSGTCARQNSGTIDVLAGFKWLVANGVIGSLGSLSQLNTGWEICSTAGGPETFGVSSYSVQAST